MCWNQPARVDHLRKKWRAVQKKNSKKRASRPCASVDPRLAGDRWSLAGRRSTPAQGRPGSFFLDFLIFFQIVYWKLGRMGA
jgi:hypothetical protein